MKWDGHGHFTTLHGHTIVFSGRPIQGMPGVAVWIHRKVAGTLVGYKPISDQVIVVLITSAANYTAFFSLTGLRKILRVSWTAKKTNVLILNKAEVKRLLLDTVKARKLAYYGHTMRKQGSCLSKDIMHEQCKVHDSEEDHTRPGWTTSIHGQDSPW